MIGREGVGQNGFNSNSMCYGMVSGFFIKEAGVIGA